MKVRVLMGLVALAALAMALYVPRISDRNRAIDSQIRKLSLDRDGYLRDIAEAKECRRLHGPGSKMCGCVGIRGGPTSRMSSSIQDAILVSRPIWLRDVDRRLADLRAERQSWW